MVLSLLWPSPLPPGFMRQAKGFGLGRSRGVWVREVLNIL